MRVPIRVSEKDWYEKEFSESADERYLLNIGAKKTIDKNCEF